MGELPHGSYDQSVKLWDARTGKAPALTFSHGASVESVLFLPSGGLLATAGDIFVRRRKKNATEEEEEEVVGSEFAWTMPKPEKQALKPSYYRYFLRGQNEKAKEGDFVISRPKKAKFAEHDKLLRKFRHKDALGREARTVGSLERAALRRRSPEAAGMGGGRGDDFMGEGEEASPEKHWFPLEKRRSHGGGGGAAGEEVVRLGRGEEALAVMKLAGM
uniref:Uncharacterized protein n=1 Tax=Aegilops tauschii TaxID=37682 RepID=N1R4X5_AEGTA